MPAPHRHGRPGRAPRDGEGRAGRVDALHDRRSRGRRAGALAVIGVVAVVAVVALGGCDLGDADTRPEPSSAPVASGPSEAADPQTSAAPAPTPTPAPTPSASVNHGPALESATWGDREGGRSLAVVPAPWVRTSQDLAAVDQLWAELVEAEPEADTTGMYDQLVCHAIGAPDKDSWNLEPWRPDVGLVAVMQARCNPR